jgi:hypothetical protein
VKGKPLMEQPQKTRRGGSKPGRKITRLPLSTLNGLIVEAGRVYRRMKDGKMDHEHGRSLVWVLGQLRAMLEAQHLERIEEKLNRLAETAEARGIYSGHTRTIGEARLPN